MPKPRAILKRRKAVQNIAKITKTMQMIATARFKKAFDRAVAARPYTDRLTRAVGRALRGRGRASAPAARAARRRKRVVVLAIARNRGLCGGYNAGVVRATLAAVRAAARARGTALELARRRASKLGGVAASSRASPSDALHAQFEDKPSFAQVDDGRDDAPRALRDGRDRRAARRLHEVPRPPRASGRWSSRCCPLVGARRRAATATGPRARLRSSTPTRRRSSPTCSRAPCGMHVFQAFLDAAVSASRPRAWWR